MLLELLLSKSMISSRPDLIFVVVLLTPELVPIYISLLAEPHLFRRSNFQVLSISSVTTKICDVMLYLIFMCLF